MTAFKRITNQEMEVLVAYMDDEVREEVHSRFAPCTNEEFVGQVFLRGGILKEAIVEVLHIEPEELERTFVMIDSIKTFMACFNLISYMKKMYPNRDFATEKSEKGRKYRHCLDHCCDYIERFRNEIPGFRVLSDLGAEFPEIDFYIDSAHVFYKWDGVIM